jgi:hypothetical protein
MKRCTGIHTMLSEFSNGKTDEEKKQAANAFPVLIIGHGDNEKDAREDAKKKARAAAKDFCAKKPCANGGCKWVNYDYSEVLIRDSSDGYCTITWDIKYIECKCKGEDD